MESTYPGVKFTFAGRDEIDIAQPGSVQKMVALKPDFIINCAAYTQVDKAETDKKSAKLINETGSRHLIEAAEAADAVLIHYSSDYVYHIKKKGPLKESDPKKPQGIYAKTKWRGDKIVATYKKHIILRTSWVFAEEGTNFVNTMIKLGENRDSLNIVDDQWGAPTFTRDLVTATMTIIDTMMLHPGKKYYGTYNYSNEGLVSWYDFATAIFDLKGKQIALGKTTTAAYNAPAPRPHWSHMSKNKFKKTFKAEIPHWYDALRRCLKAQE